MENVNKAIIISVLGFVAIAFIAIVVMVYVAIAHGSAMKKIIADESIKNETLIGMGGNILDDKNAYLAYYSPTFDVAWDTKVANRYINKIKEDLKKEMESEEPDSQFILKCQRILKFNSTDSLAYYLNANFKNKNGGKSFAQKIDKAYTNNTTHNLICSGVILEEVDLLRTFPFFHLRQFTGGFLLTENYRVDFLNKSITGRTLGQDDFRDTIRKQGLVYAYRDTLMGGIKNFKIERTAKSYKPLDIGEDFVPADGRNVVTSLNYEISEFAYTALMRQMKKCRGERGCVIVMDVKTGDIKAMVSLVESAGGAYYHSENVAIKNVYSPGSVFKLASFMVAANDGLLDWNKKYELGTSESKQVGPKLVKDSHKPKNAFADAKEIFSESSNIGTCMMVWELYSNNQQKYIDGLRKMHIGEQTGIELVGEGKAFLKDTKTKIKNKEWWNISLLQIAFGYEVDITPLQMATFYNAVANNGVYVKPRLVTEIGANKDNKIQKNPVVVIDTICSPEVAAKAREILVAAAHEGTGRNSFKDANYKFAGKTGTSENYENGSFTYHDASFAGFFPAEDPIYSIYVFVGKPKVGRGFAAEVAVPVAREIADKIAATDKRFFEEIIIDKSTSNVWNKIESINNGNNE